MHTNLILWFKGTMQRSKLFKFCYDFTGCKIEYFRILVRVRNCKWREEACVLLLEGQGSIEADGKAQTLEYTWQRKRSQDGEDCEAN